MENTVWIHNMCNACEQYTMDFIEKQKNAGASVNDLMQYFDPDVRFPAMNLQEFAEKYLDEQTRNEWEKRCEEEGDIEYGTRFEALSLFTSMMFCKLGLIAEDFFDGESQKVLANDAHLWEYLDIKKKEKRDRFDLIYEVAEYIYCANLIESLEELDHYRECIWDAIYGWCEKHSDLIREKYALEANDYPLTPLF